MRTGQAWEGGPLAVVVGEVLLVVCSVCYLVWWTTTFRPSGRTATGSGLVLGGAVLTGLAGVVLLAAGALTLLPRASAPALAATVVGGVLVGVLLLVVTSGVLHRPVTTELPLIVLWATAQLAAGTALRTAGVLGPPAASAWVVATGIATVVGLVCYLVFYRLDPVPAYRVGMVPLALDGVVAATLAALLALART